VSYDPTLSEIIATVPSLSTDRARREALRSTVPPDVALSPLRDVSPNMRTSPRWYEGLSPAQARALADALNRA
jgi:hypothetical protein